MKKILLFLTLISAVTSFSFAKKSPKKYSFGTGSSGGNFYLVGGGLANLINKHLGDRFVFTAEETGGSTANLALIESGEAELGIAMTSTLYEGAKGTAKWTNGKPMKNVRGLVPLYPSHMTIYTRENSGINSLGDFNGHVVGLGSKGAAMDGVLRGAFDKLGVKPSSIFNDGHGATAKALGQGQIDVAVLFSFPPFPAISELEATKKLGFIGLTKAEQDFLVKNYPYYSASVLPKGSYNGVKADIPTVSEWNMLVASAKLSNDDAYLIAKTLFENNPELLVIHKSLSYATVDNAKAFNIPLHPGVVKYLREKGVALPDNLLK